MTTGNTGRSTRRAFLAATGASVSLLAGCADSTEPGDVTTQTATTEPDTMIVTWRGGDPTTATTTQWLVEADDEPSSVDVTLAPFEDGDSTTVETGVESFSLPRSYKKLYRHRAVFDGLSPDTAYEIEIDGEATSARTKTAPVEHDEPLRFAEGGDIGTSSSVPPLHQQAATRDPLFALVGGDLAYANGVSLDKWLTFLKQWNTNMRSGNRLIPIVAGIGNHEVQGGMHGTPEEAPFFYTLFDNRQRERAYWALDIGPDVSILVLDSNHTTPVPGAQTEWFEQALAERSDRTHLVAAYHVPAYPSAKAIEGAGRDRVDVREQWVPLLEEYGVDVAFEHDDHTYKRTHLLEDGQPSEDGILYVGDGAWGRGPRTAKTPEERPYLARSASKLHVIDVTLSPDRSREFRALGTDGTVIDHFDESGVELS